MATARRAPTVAMMAVAVGSRGGKDGNHDSNSAPSEQQWWRSGES